MDYKYIETLIERYFAGETTLEEERILKTFFLQEEVPANLQRYAPIFTFEAEAKTDVLDEDFDLRIEQRLEESGDLPVKRVRIKRLTFTDRIRPLTRAAAAVAIVALIGNGIHTAYLTGTYTPVEGEAEEALEAEIEMPAKVPGAVPEKYIQENEKIALSGDSIGVCPTVD